MSESTMSTTAELTSEIDELLDESKPIETRKESHKKQRLITKYVLKFCNNGLACVTGFVLNVLFCGFVFSKFEPYGLFDSIYWGTTSAFTVGYGDISPKSVPGKLLAEYTFVSSWVLIALVTAHIIIWAIRNADLFSDDEQKALFKLLRKILAKIVELITKVEHLIEKVKEIDSDIDEIDRQLDEIDDQVDDLTEGSQPRPV